MSNELPRPIAYATHNGMRSLQQDDATVLLYPHDYLIRPDQVHLYTADQMREYGRACERAAYERAAKECEAQISGSDHYFLAIHGRWDHMAQAATNCAAAIRALGADK